MPGNEVAIAHSTTFAEAAGLDGRQKSGLVLSSSARVTQMTYQTVLGVRYPELVSPSHIGPNPLSPPFKPPLKVLAWDLKA